MLYGGAGNDTLRGAAGNDILSGNGGADTFIFEDDSGHDEIMDFEVGVDTLDIRGWAGFHSAWWDREVNVSVVDGSTTIAFNDQSITLIGVDYTTYGSPSKFAQNNMVWTPEADVNGDPLVFA